VGARGDENSWISSASDECCRLARSDAPRGRYLKVHGDAEAIEEGALEGDGDLARSISFSQSTKELRTRGSQHTCAWHVSHKHDRGAGISAPAHTRVTAHLRVARFTKNQK
jgi:hypothetical protein